jgi:succinate-semialdehyde dehydrogenase/glutarate-semialdehyde dehydrogenase
MPSYPELKLYVAGEWRSRDGAPVINPADESILGTVPRATVKDSGYGREGGTEGLECYTVAKNVSHLVQ